MRSEHLNQMLQTKLFVFLIIGQTYSHVTYYNVSTLVKNILYKGTPSHEILPTQNDTLTFYLSVHYLITSIIDVDDVNQKFVCRGSFFFSWMDTRMTWDSGKYGKWSVTLPAEDIWTPRFVVANSVRHQEVITHNKLGGLIVLWYGIVLWEIGDIFSTSCDLDMSKYPFDEQSCQIQIFTNSFPTEKIQFATESYTVDQDKYVEHEEWALTSTQLQISNNSYTVFATVTFHIKRRPAFLLVNNILPVVILSFMNLLVFVVPAESEEKLTYGITVLMALFVHSDSVLDKLPTSGKRLPLINIYFGILVILSILSVMVSSIIAKLDSLKKKDDFREKRGRTSDKISPEHVTTDDQSCDHTEMRTRGQFTHSTESVMTTQNYKDEGRNQENDSYMKAIWSNSQVIWNHIDLIFFCLFFCAWLSVTVGFMIKLAT